MQISELPTSMAGISMDVAGKGCEIRLFPTKTENWNGVMSERDGFSHLFTSIPLDGPCFPMPPFQLTYQIYPGFSPKL